MSTIINTFADAYKWAADLGSLFSQTIPFPPRLVPHLYAFGINNIIGLTEQGWIVKSVRSFRASSQISVPQRSIRP